MKLLHLSKIVVGIAMATLFVACSDNDGPNITMPDQPEPPTPVNFQYEVSIVNLTHAQPMSPIAVMVHNESTLWEIGMSASQALELLAESGDNNEVLALPFVLASQSGTGVLMPGMSESIVISIEDNQPQFMSIITMLVNTNDAFTGVNALEITNIDVGESISLRTGSYDAGTENNSETMASIPGPASGGSGEGFNMIRNDVDYVAMHPGVVTLDDGLTGSVLTQAHRFDNPTMAIKITRLE